MASLEAAARLGVTFVEFDVRLSLDGRCVVIHDEHLERTTNGIGTVSRIPFAALAELDAGAWFSPAFTGAKLPSLEDILAAAISLDLGCNIEIKAQGGNAEALALAVAGVVARVWPSGRPPPLLSSFEPSVLRVLAERAPSLPRTYLANRLGWGWSRRAARLGCIAAACDQRWLSPRRVAKLKAAGLPILAFTVNDPDRARNLWAWGVDSVFSDVPHRLGVA